MLVCVGVEGKPYPVPVSYMFFYLCVCVCVCVCAAQSVSMMATRLDPCDMGQGRERTGARSGAVQRPGRW